MAHELSPGEQIVEIEAEFEDEAANYKLATTQGAKQVAMNHINALLDAYIDIRLELAYTEGMGVE